MLTIFMFLSPIFKLKIFFREKIKFKFRIKKQYNFINGYKLNFTQVRFSLIGETILNWCCLNKLWRPLFCPICAKHVRFRRAQTINKYRIFLTHPRKFFILPKLFILSNLNFPVCEKFISQEHRVYICPSHHRSHTFLSFL